MSKRDFSIDMMGIAYGLDSDEIDELERIYAEKGAPLKEHADYRRAFDARAFPLSASVTDSATMSESASIEITPEPIPEPLTLEEIETLAEGAGAFVVRIDYIYGAGNVEMQTAKARYIAAIDRAREIANYMEQEQEERDIWEGNPEAGNVPALTWEELATLADIADALVYPEHAKPIDKEQARRAANRARDNIARILYEQEQARKP